MMKDKPLDHAVIQHKTISEMRNLIYGVEDGPFALMQKAPPNTIGEAYETGCMITQTCRSCKAVTDVDWIKAIRKLGATYSYIKYYDLARNLNCVRCNSSEVSIDVAAGDAGKYWEEVWGVSKKTP